MQSKRPRGPLDFRYKSLSKQSTGAKSARTLGAGYRQHPSNSLLTLQTTAGKPVDQTQYDLVQKLLKLQELKDNKLSM